MRAMLTVEGVFKHFGGVRALDGVTFEAVTENITGIIGPNGAGKTTVFNIISGVLEPDGGRVRLDGEDITAAPAHEIAARGVARTFQNVQTFDNMTALENVMVGRHTKSRAGMLAASLRLPRMRAEEGRIRECALALLDIFGMGCFADRPAAQLTFACQRQLEIVRALAAEPRLLLLDEPAAGLNPRETKDLGRKILDIRARGVTTLIVDHDMDLVMDICDEVVVLDLGRVIGRGKPAEVQSDAKVIRAYLGE